ncbi:hypothetical protein K438DRAFT_1998156 [Mycena galopus ATCC 62051]|nr:hypothetical protein K438DRAFT_1998156 [Mycena galopus ATCC 62051]
MSQSWTPPSGWGRPAMSEFCGSSPANPLLLDINGELVIQGSLNHKKAVFRGIIQGPPSSIRQDLPDRFAASDSSRLATSNSSRLVESNPARAAAVTTNHGVYSAWNSAPPGPQEESSILRALREFEAHLASNAGPRRRSTRIRTARQKKNAAPAKHGENAAANTRTSDE